MRLYTRITRDDLRIGVHRSPRSGAYGLAACQAPRGSGGRPWRDLHVSEIGRQVEDAAHAAVREARRVRWTPVAIDLRSVQERTPAISFVWFRGSVRLPDAS